MIKTFGEGRVAADAKVVEYREGKTLVSFGLICNRFYGDEHPTYVQMSIYNANEKIAQHITTGKQIVFCGNLTRNEKGYYSVDIQDWSFGAVPAGRGTQERDERHDSYYDNVAGEPEQPFPENRRDARSFQ